jgi:hypothetical protein
MPSDDLLSPHIKLTSRNLELLILRLISIIGNKESEQSENTRLLMEPSMKPPNKNQTPFRLACTVGQGHRYHHSIQTPQRGAVVFGYTIAVEDRLVGDL